MSRQTAWEARVHVDFGKKRKLKAFPPISPLGLKMKAIWGSPGLSQLGDPSLQQASRARHLVAEDYLWPPTGRRPQAGCARVLSAHHAASHCRHSCRAPMWVARADE